MGAGPSKLQKNNNKLHIVDYGSIVPLGLYERNDDYDMEVVQSLIVSKRLSPFYKGLSDPPKQQDCSNDTPIQSLKRNSSSTKKRKFVHLIKEINYDTYLYDNEKKLYSILYNTSIECPICFLYYPANINFTRCCDQPICTECFVQIKKRSSDTSHCCDSDIVCPYCMTDNFGIVYHCPLSPTINLEKKFQMEATTSGLSQHQESKRKSLESDHPNVVLINHVRVKPSDTTQHSSVGDMRETSYQLWFQSGSSRDSNVTSLDRYGATSIVLNDLSIQDMMAFESLRESLINKESHQRRRRNLY